MTPQLEDSRQIVRRDRNIINGVGAALLILAMAEVSGVIIFGRTIGYGTDTFFLALIVLVGVGLAAGAFLVDRAAGVIAFWGVDSEGFWLGQADLLGIPYDSIASARVRRYPSGATYLRVRTRVGKRYSIPISGFGEEILSEIRNQMTRRGHSLEPLSSAALPPATANR